MTTALAAVTDADREFARIIDELTRRGFLAGGAGTAALLGLAACGGDGHPSSGTGTAAPWTVTDDLGRTITLPSRPTRIVSLGDDITALLWSQGLHAIVGSPLYPPDNGQLQSSGVPVGRLTKFSTGQYSGFSLEKIAGLRPDLIIDEVQNGKAAASSGTPDIAKIAPVFALTMTANSLDDLFAHAQRLVTALGVAPSASAPAKTAYATAAARVKAVLAGKPGLRAAFCQAYGANLIVTTWVGFPLYGTLHQLGLDFAPVQAKPGGSQLISWELVPKLPADVLFINGGDGPITNPGWKAMPAVKAGQVIDTRPWEDGAGVYGYGYTYLTAVLDHITTALAPMKPGVGPR